GHNASASISNSVALGSSSTTAAATPTAGITLDGTPYTFAGGSPLSVVSVGQPNQERQITNVAAGQVTETSTDAVNGSQLFATNQALTALGSSGTGSTDHYFSVNDGGVIGGNFNSDGATGDGALAAGVEVTASGDNSVAVGTHNLANGANSLAIGST